VASSIERIQIKLPGGFDPAKHQAALMKKITEAHGPGFDLDSIDPVNRVAHASRQVAITEVTNNVDVTDHFDVRLARGTKEADGARICAKLEDQYADQATKKGGFYVTRFEPFLGKATLTRLTDDEARCRGAIAVALGSKPWDVQVKSRRDGGFDLELPRNYQPAKASKIEEVATSVVGREGWYADIDARKLTASIIPSEPPTFPAGFATPLDRLGKGNIDKIPFGRALPKPGEEVGPEVVLDWTDSAWALLAGTPGSGKSVWLNCVLADALSNGSELVVIDDKSKAVDFEPFKPFVRDHGWGCESLEAAVAALGLVREEGERRAKVLKQMGLNNWLDMPAGKRFKPILIIFDEVSAVLVPDPPLKGIPKDHPLFLENERTNLAKAMIGSFSTKIIAELRFVGIRMVMATQATNNNTGVGPSTRTKMGHFILQGVNPSKSARTQIFADESTVPTVPENVKGGGSAARGVGVADLGGQSPVVYKTYFASPNDYAAKLKQLGVPTTNKPEPTSGQIDRFLPTIEDDRDSQPARRGGGQGGVELAPSGRPAAAIAAEMGDTYGQSLHDGSLGDDPFARANAARHAAKVGAGVPAQTKKQKMESSEESTWAAQSGEVTVKKRTPDQNNPFASTDDDW
jgi:hypothetical protein